MNTTAVERKTMTSAAAAKLRCSQTNRCHDGVVVVLGYCFAPGTRLNHYPLCATHQQDYSRDTPTLRVIKEVKP